MKMHIKRGDEVVVINGTHAGKRGKVMEVMVAKQRAIVEGVNIITKHEKKKDETHPGGIVKREAALQVSKLMLASKYDARKARRSAPAA
jgi:large subunit ribosomal protein L24